MKNSQKGFVPLIALFIFVGVLVLGGAGYWFYQNQNQDPQLIGGQKDEHGCLGPAGYSWCAPKNKCLRIWEEQCYINVEQEIEYLLAEKYTKTADEVSVTIAKQNDNYMAGGVLFGNVGSGEGGLVLAAKIDNVWTVVYDGNGSIDCNKMRTEYNFPDEILKPNYCD